MSYDVRFSDYACSKIKVGEDIEHLRTYITVTREDAKTIKIDIHDFSFPMLHWGSFPGCPVQHWEKIKEVTDNLIEEARRWSPRSFSKD